MLWLLLACGALDQIIILVFGSEGFPAIQQSSKVLSNCSGRCLSSITQGSFDNSNDKPNLDQFSHHRGNRTQVFSLLLHITVEHFLVLIIIFLLICLLEKEKASSLLDKILLAALSPVFHLFSHLRHHYPLIWCAHGYQTILAQSGGLHATGLCSVFTSTGTISLPVIMVLLPGLWLTTMSF